MVGKSGWHDGSKNMTGPRNPHETAEQIASCTLNFFSRVRGRNPSVSEKLNRDTVQVLVS